METNKSEIESVLSDVRRAYRLLHDYQRLALDSVAFIGRELRLTAVGGGPVFSDGAKIPGFDRWAWDWLNLFAFRWVFGETTKEGTSVHLSILLLSDTASFLVGDTWKEPRVSDFQQSAEQSETKVLFFLCIGTEATMVKIRDVVGKRSAVWALVSDLESARVELKSSGIEMLSCNFASMSTQEGARCIVAELRQIAERSGIPLSPPSAGG